MSKYRIEVTEVTRAVYEVEARDQRDAEEQVLGKVRTGYSYSDVREVGPFDDLGEVRLRTREVRDD